MKKVLKFLLLFMPFLALAQNINDIKLKTLDNKVKTIKEYKGKTYVKMWASWCSVCLATMDHTLELSKDKNKDFNVTTLVSPGNLREKKFDDFKKWFVGTNWRNLEVLSDETGDIISKVRLRGYPTNLFINSKGEIERVIPGPLSNDTVKAIMAKIN